MRCFTSARLNSLLAADLAVILLHVGNTAMYAFCPFLPLARYSCTKLSQRTRVRFDTSIPQPLLREFGPTGLSARTFHAHLASAVRGFDLVRPWEKPAADCRHRRSRRCGPASDPARTHLCSAARSRARANQDPVGYRCDVRSQPWRPCHVRRLDYGHRICRQSLPSSKPELLFRSGSSACVCRPSPLPSARSVRGETGIACFQPCEAPIEIPADRHGRSTLVLNAIVFLDLNEVHVGRRCRKCGTVTLETKKPGGDFPDRAQFRASYYASRSCSDEVDAPFAVIAGLDPAIHPFAKMMDPRVKPAGDA